MGCILIYSTNSKSNPLFNQCSQYMFCQKNRKVEIIYMGSMAEFHSQGLDKVGFFFFFIFFFEVLLNIFIVDNEATIAPELPSL